MNIYILAFGLGLPEIAVIVFVVLLLFGAKKLPELARGMGKGIREFKKASSEISYEMDREMDRRDYEREQARHQKEEKTEASEASEAKPTKAEVEETKGSSESKA